MILLEANLIALTTATTNIIDIWLTVTLFIRFSLVVMKLKTCLREKKKMH